MNAIAPVASAAAIAAPLTRQAEQPLVRNAPPSPTAVQPVKQAEPIRYYGGIDGMNATNLIVALQSNGASSGYSVRPIEAGGTPPPALIDRGA